MRYHVSTGRYACALSFGALLFGLSAAGCSSSSQTGGVAGASNSGGLGGNASGGGLTGNGGAGSTSASSGASSSFGGVVSSGGNGGVTAGSPGNGGVAGGNAGVPGGNPGPDGTGPGTIEGTLGDPTQDQEIQWKVTKGGGTLDAWAWAPGGVTELRGWIVNVQFGNQYKEFARLLGFGLMAFDPQQYHDVADWDVGFELQAAQEAAAKFGHPEAANAPFLATGHSIASGSGGLFLLRGAPQRLIGLAPGGMSYGYKQDDMVLQAASEKVPLILFRGSRTNDSSSGIPDELASNRAMHAEVAYAIQWGAKHEFGLAANIILPMWWRSVIQRYPAELKPGAAPVALKEVPEETGWLGDASEWTPSPPDLNVPAFTVPTIAPFASFTGDKSKAVWLLDSYVAHVWQAYQSTDDTIHITAPPRMPDGIAMVEKGGKLSVTIESGTAAPSPITKLDLYDGDQKLGTSTEGSHTFDGLDFGPGVHALIAVATMQGGKILTSRPTVVLGIRGACPTMPVGVPVTCVHP